MTAPQRVKKVPERKTEKTASSFGCRSTPADSCRRNQKQEQRTNAAQAPPAKSAGVNLEKGKPLKKSKSVKPTEKEAYTDTD